jgi:hypothetical protein
MRFSTILAASTMAIFSIVSAQLTTDTAALAACGTCINNAGIAAVPSCKGLSNDKPDSTPTAPTAQQKACWCGLKNSKNWADSCVASDKCTAATKDQLVMAINTVSGQPGFCDGVSATSAAGARFCGASSAQVAAAGAAALAVAGALL